VKEEQRDPSVEVGEGDGRRPGSQDPGGDGHKGNGRASDGECRDHRGKSFGEIQVPETERLPFRFDRHSIEEFADLAVACRIQVGEDTEPIELRVKDLSSSGLSFQVEDASAWQEKQTIARLRLCFDEWTAYDGKAVVRSVRCAGNGAVVGLSLTDYLLNIDEVLRMQEVKVAHRRYTDLTRNQVAEWTVPSHAEFKARLTEFMLFLDAAREQMRALEKELNWEEIHGTTPNAARDALFRQIDQCFVQDWNRWLIELNGMYLSNPEHASKNMELFTRRLLHPYVLEAPFMYRAFVKPLKYPGDFVLMNYIYGNGFEGGSLFAKAVHRSAASVPGAEAVRSRKRLLIEEMRACYQRHREASRTMRIASIASGPAQELCEFLESQEFDVPVQILLFEQEKQALAYSNRNLMGILTSRRLQKVSILSMRDSVKSLFTSQTLLEHKAPYDFIYAAGLFDYLPRHFAINLTQRLWNLLAPRGSLYIGNFSHGNTSRWAMEGMLDWDLIHRTPEEVREFASTCPDDSSVEVIAEPTGVNLFLRCRREV